jgi:C4-dicarboxylate transporter DctM subunit
MGLVVLFVLIVSFLFSVPIGMALGISALAGILYKSSHLLILLPQKFLAGIDSFPLLAIPLFILAGTIMSYGGIARRIVDLSLVFVGRIRGGLAFVVIFSTMLFSGISGSPSANTAAIGSVALPAMMRRQYPRDFATAVFAAAGGTSILVPPSVDFIVVGVIAGISIGGLFAAGLLPAAVNGLALLLLAFSYARKLDLPVQPRISWTEKLRQCRDGLLPILMVIIVLGGIYGGVFTPTEAAAVAVVYGFLLAVFVYKELRVADIPRALLRTASLTGVVLLVMAMAHIFSYVLTLERIPHLLADLIAEYATNWIGFVVCVNVVFLLIGMITDALPAYVVLLPILMPVGVALGMEPIHLGTLIIANVGLGMITPPVGITLFIACGISKTPVEKMVRPLVPFLIVLTFTLLVISYLPEITLFLPRMLGYVGH